MTRKEEAVANATQLARAKEQEEQCGTEFTIGELIDFYVKGAEWAERTMLEKASIVKAEIEKRYNECLQRAKIVDADYWNGNADAYRNMLEFLDTLEVKETVLESSENILNRLDKVKIAELLIMRM